MSVHTPSALGGAGKRLLRRATTVSAFTALGVAAGFLVDVLLVARFGIGSHTDAYFGAYTVPLILISSLSAVSPVLVTILAGYRGDDSAFSVLLNAAGLATLGVAVLGALLAGPIVAVITPGFSPATAAQAVGLTRILFARVPAAALAEVCRSELYSRQRFALGAFSNGLPSLVTALALLIPGTTWGIEGVAVAVVVGTLAQTLLLMGVLFGGLRQPYRATLRHPTPLLRQTGRLLWAPLAGMLFRQGVTLAERFFGSHLPAGSVTALSYASRLTMTVAGISFNGIATASLPSLTERWAKGPVQEARAELTALIRLMTNVALPLGLLLAALATPLVLLLFERGQVTHQAALLTGWVLSVYALSLVSLGPFRAAQNFFYAVRETRPIIILHGSLTALTIFLDLLLVRPFGAVGLALSICTSSGIIAVASLLWLSRRAVGLAWRRLLDAFWRLGAASLAMAAAAFGVSRWAEPFLQAAGKKGQLLDLALGGLAGLVVFLIVGSLLRVEALSILWGIGWRKLARSFRSKHVN
jgi:putative peptidoglycan lipid II flippase